MNGLQPKNTSEPRDFKLSMLTQGGPKPWSPPLFHLYFTPMYSNLCQLYTSSNLLQFISIYTNFHQISPIYSYLLQFTPIYSNIQNNLIFTSLHLFTLIYLKQIREL